MLWFDLAGASHLHTTITVHGKVTTVSDYATVQGIFIGVVAAYVILITIFGPEYVFCFS